MRARAVGMLLVLALVAAGCSMRTIGAHKGDLRLTADFDDVSNLVVGHSVQMSDVTVGTVTGIELEGYEARVTMQIDEDLRLPEDTEAVVAKTSLLGEQYVQLVLPPGGNAEGPYLESGDQIRDTRIAPEFEAVTQRAVEVLGAMTAEDVNTIVSTGAGAIGGRGEDLNELIADLSTVVVDLDSQRGEITQAIDGFARLSRELAANDDQVVQLVDDLSAASATLAENRDRIVSALSGIRDMTQVTNDAVLIPHVDDLTSMIGDLDPIIATLAEQRPIIEELLDSVNRFLLKIARNVSYTSGAGAQAQFIWARGLASPSGTVGQQSDQEQPAPPSFEPPEQELALPGPEATLASVFRLVDGLLALLALNPDGTLPPEVCELLVQGGGQSPLAQFCEASGGQTLPVPIDQGAPGLEELLPSGADPLGVGG